MQTVEPGHQEIDTEKYMRIGPFDTGVGVIFSGKLSQMKFVAVFEKFHYQKYSCQSESSQQEIRSGFDPVKLDAHDRQRHGDRAGDQDDSVQHSQPVVKGIMRVMKNIRFPGAIDRIGCEQASEKEDLGHEEYPHSKFSGFPLLSGVGKMIQQFGSMMK